MTIWHQSKVATFGCLHCTNPLIATIQESVLHRNPAQSPSGISNTAFPTARLSSLSLSAYQLWNVRPACTAPSYTQRPGRPFRRTPYSRPRTRRNRDQRVFDRRQAIQESGLSRDCVHLPTLADPHEPRARLERGAARAQSPPLRGAKSGGRVASEDEAEAGHESAEGVRAGAAGVQVADEGAEGVGDQAEARYLAKCARVRPRQNER
jgi:hypothetical protein